MKLVLFLFLFLFTLSTFSEKSFSLSYYEIKKFCEKERSERKCINDLREKKSNLQKGNFIEIPIVPYRR